MSCGIFRITKLNVAAALETGQCNYYKYYILEDKNNAK